MIRRWWKRYLYGGSAGHQLERCPFCGQTFDIRDLGQVLLHRDHQLAAGAPPAIELTSPGNADGGRGEPARGHHGSQPGDRQQAEAGQQPGAATQRAADAGALGGTGDLVDVDVIGADILVGDDADVGGGHARALHRIGRRQLPAFDGPGQCSSIVIVIALACR